MSKYIKNSLLDYYKMVLEKVSFDNILLRKEYYKALKGLSFQEAHELYKWAHEKGFINQMNPYSNSNNLLINMKYHENSTDIATL